MKNITPRLRFMKAVISQVFLYPYYFSRAAPIIGEMKLANAYINPYASFILSLRAESCASFLPSTIYKSTYILSIISGRIGIKTKTYTRPRSGNADIIN
jgi:hypothetical protein